MNFNFAGSQSSENVVLSSNESPASIYIKAARWVVLLSVVLLPLFFLPWSGSVLEFNKQLLLVIGVGAALILWLLDIVVSGKIKVRFTYLDYGILGILVATIIASIFSVSTGKSIFGNSGSMSDSLISVFAFSLLYFLVVNLFDDGGKAIRKALGISLFVVFLYGFFQILSWNVLPLDFTNSRAFNSVGSLNSLGLIAALSLSLLLKLSIPIRNIKFLDIAKLGAVLALAILVILNWWVLWVVAIVGMLALIAFESLMSAGEGKFKITRFIFPMTIIVLAAFLMLVNFNLQVLKKNFPVEVAPSYKLSTDISKSVLEESLIVGYGPENFINAFDKYGAGKLSDTLLPNARFFDATSQFFTYITGAGLLGILAVVGLLWVTIRTLVRFRRYGGVMNESSGEVVASLALVVSLLVAFFLYPFNLTAMSIFYVGLASMALVLWRNKKELSVEDRPSLSLASSLGFIAGLILVLAGAYFLFIQYLADVRFAQAAKQTEIQASVDKIIEAINLNDSNDSYYRLASQRALSLLSQELNKPADRNDVQRTSRIQGYITSAIDLARKATEAGPNDSNNWFNLGDIYQQLIGLVEGVDVLSEESFVKSVELRPGDPTIYNRIGSMYLSKADLSRRLAASSSGENANRLVGEAVAALSKSETNFKKAVEVSPNFGLAIYNLGVVYERQGKINEAIRQLERIIPANANQPNLVFELGLLYYRAGQKENSFAALQRAVTLSPDYANARWYLALIHEERKELPLAIQQLENILKNNPDNQVVKDKMTQLQQGVTTIPPERVIDQQPL